MFIPVKICNKWVGENEMFFVYRIRDKTLSKLQNEVSTASFGNRTRGSRLASGNFTTKPMMLKYCL